MPKSGEVEQKMAGVCGVGRRRELTSLGSFRCGIRGRRSSGLAASTASGRAGDCKLCTPIRKLPHPWCSSGKRLLSLPLLSPPLSPLSLRSPLLKLLLSPGHGLLSFLMKFPSPTYARCFKEGECSVAYTSVLAHTFSTFSNGRVPRCEEFW